MTLAARAREAARERPVLHEALRAGVVNYTAAARALDLDGDDEAVATALRRYAEELDPREDESLAVRVRMESGVSVVEGAAGEDAPLLTVGGTAVDTSGGSSTAIVATGGVDTAALADVLARLSVASIPVETAGVGGETLVVVVGRRDAPDALRAVESVL